MKSLHSSEIQDQQRLMHDENIAFQQSLGDSQEHITRLQREMDSQSQAFSLQEHAAMTLCRSQLFEAESAATIAGAAAGPYKAEADARAIKLSSEDREGIEKMRILHRSEYVETQSVSDEQIRELMDSIKVLRGSLKGGPGAHPPFSTPSNIFLVIRGRFYGNICTSAEPDALS